MSFQTGQEGIEAAVAHAERVHGNDWKRQALVHAREYMALKGSGSDFLVSDMRIWAQQRGCPVPPSQRAWAGVIHALKASGEVVAVGARTQGYTDPFAERKANFSSRVLWRIA